MATNLIEALNAEYDVYSACNSSSDERMAILASSHLTHIEALKNRLAELGVSAPLAVSNSVLSKDVYAMEDSLLGIYSRLTSIESDAINLDLLYKIEANIYNNHLPMLSGFINQNNMANNLLNQVNGGKELIAETQDMLFRLQNGELSQGELEGFLNKLNYSLIGGMIAGAFGAMILNEFLNKNKEE